MAITNFLLDAAILGVFLVAFEPRLTGVTVHEWLSLGFAGMVIVHLLLHWRWMVAVTFRFFSKVVHASRLDYVVDGLLFICFTLVMLSGFLISRSVLPSFGLQPPHEPIWLELHTFTANLTLLLTGLHFGLHWRWLVKTAGRLSRLMRGNTSFINNSHSQ